MFSLATVDKITQIIFLVIPQRIVQGCAKLQEVSNIVN